MEFFFALKNAGIPVSIKEFLTLKALRHAVEKQPAAPFGTPSDIESFTQIHTGHPADFVDDATMNPYEILQPGGSVEYGNEEAGIVWLQRFIRAFPYFIWFNPAAEEHCQYRHSVSLIRQIMRDRLFPLTLDGIARGIKNS